MSHPHGRALSDKQNVLHHFDKHVKSTSKKCSAITINRSTPNCKCSKFDDGIDERHKQKHLKVKRLKTRKERSHLRGSRVEFAKSTSQHHLNHQTCKEKGHSSVCCKNNSFSHQRKDAPFVRAFAVAREPSFITDSRLTGHHGLFNHEIKSIDIERLLSEQKKLETFGQLGKLKNNTPAPLLRLPASCFPSSPRVCCKAGSVGVPEDSEKTPIFKVDSKVPQVRERAISPEVEVNEDAENSASQGTGIPPGQRQIDEHALLSENCEVFVSSINSPSISMTTANKKVGLELPQTDRDSIVPPSGDRENIRQQPEFNNIPLEHTPKNHGRPQLRTQPSSSHCSEPSLPCSSPMAASSTSSNIQTTSSACVSAVAARLCNSLELPLLRNRRLVSECREVLLQTLQERHGTQLQENLLEAQRSLSFGTGLTKTFAKNDEVRTSDPFNADFIKRCETQKSKSVKKRRKQSTPIRVSPPQVLSDPQLNVEMAEWTESPAVKDVGNLFGELLRPPSSPPFYMDLQPSESAYRGQIGDLPPASHWSTRASLTRAWDHGLNSRTVGKADGDSCLVNWRFDPDLSFLNQTESIRGGSVGSSEQSFLPFPTGPEEGHLRENGNFSQQRDSFELEPMRFGSFPSISFAPPQQQQNGRQLHPFHRFNHAPVGPVPHSYCTDMAHYPPSHMLERGVLPSLTPLPTFPSPERWSFPRMRLY